MSYWGVGWPQASKTVSVLLGIVCGTLLEHRIFLVWCFEDDCGECPEIFHLGNSREFHCFHTDETIDGPSCLHTAIRVWLFVINQCSSFNWSVVCGEGCNKCVIADGRLCCCLWANLWLLGGKVWWSAHFLFWGLSPSMAKDKARVWVCFGSQCSPVGGGVSQWYNL